MIKVILADDEILEREVYKVLINRHFPQLEVVAEAETGRQAIELFEKHKPDLVLMDVKMPGINGLEAIEIIRKKNTSTRFVIVSAYNFFDYVKEAMKFDVEEYLLKPVQKDEFVSVISKVLSKIDTEAKLTQEELDLKERLKHIMPLLEQEVFYAIMMGDHSKTEQYVPLLKLNITNGFVAIGKIKSEYLKRDDEIANNILCKKLHEYIKGSMPNLKPVLISDFINSKINFIFPLASHQDNPMLTRDVAYKKCLSIREEILQTFGVKMVFGISDQYCGIAQSKEAYNQALLVINNIEFLNMDIVNYGDIISDLSPAYLYPYELEKRLIEKIRLGLTDQSLSVFKEIFNYSTECLNNDVNKIKFELFELYFVLSRMMLETEFQSTKIKDFVISKENYFNSKSVYDIYYIFCDDIKLICTRFKDASNQKNKRIINDAINYMKNNYMRDISLEDVSRFVFVSPNYFSRVFKLETNQNFIDYLTKVRIDYAKQLILNTNKSISEVSWEVGYGEPNYFTKVFKKITGVTPSEFKDKTLNQL